MAPRKNTQPTSAEISLVHLNNCLVNLPLSLSNLIRGTNTPSQNVVVELSFRASDGGGSAPRAQRSVYVGWTGEASQQRLAPIVGRDGIHGIHSGSRSSSGAARDPTDLPLVEIDAALAQTLKLQDGQRVTASIHLDPPLAHTVNIEPLTPEDWEMIELHATLLETHMAYQIRALPNPSYSPPAGAGPASHPLTLHLSPTSTANIRITSLDPAPGTDAPFAKLDPNAEVIVAPKTRAKSSRSIKGSRSVDSASRKSSGSTVRRRGGKEERKPALFLRAVDRNLCDDWFDDDEGTEGLSVWVDGDVLFSRGFRGVKFVTVNVMRPPSLTDPRKQQADATGAVEGAVKPALRIVARLFGWDDPPNGSSVALSSPVSACLGCQGIVGGVVKLEPASQPFSLTTKYLRAPEDGTADLDSQTSIRRIMVFPFLRRGSTPSSDGLKFGGESQAEKEEAVKRLRSIYDLDGGKGLLRGPLTDGQVLAVYGELKQPLGWDGGLVKFDPPPKTSQATRDAAHWILGSEWTIPIEFQSPIPPPAWDSDEADSPEAGLEADGVLVGIDSLLHQLRSNLTHLSSVLLTGALGSGKTSVARNIASTLKQSSFFHTTYFTCRSLVNDESRIATIRETLNRLFLSASWGARLGGHSLVILDDLERLCPAETELQVGNDNGRSRQISESLCAIVRQYCTRDSGVVLLATAPGKESVNNVIIGGHVVQEIMELKSPDKDARRKIVEAITRQGPLATAPEPDQSVRDNSRPPTAVGSTSGDEGAWMMDGSTGQPSPLGAPPRTDGFVLAPDLDFLDVAGKTDGYMPGDLVLLVTRARNAALSRSIAESPDDDHVDAAHEGSGVLLGMEDFDEALKGFTPASLHNVRLQSSSTTFDSIGGLRETRRVLLETLQYPTRYAPIFAQCPLRLRSGLLLYGYPGCGKTLLASAVAGECGLNFISVKGPEILNKYIGASEKSVRDLFERAQAAKPCVLFFDEFDSVAPKRGHDSTGVTDRVVNQLLTQMDGAEGLSGVYVLAATSRPDLIDPALLRPGRLDKSLLCDFPNLEDRLDIIKALAAKVNMSDEVLESEEDLVELARRTEGLTGADLQALMSNSQLEAIHDVLDSGNRGVPGGASSSSWGPGRTRDGTTRTDAASSSSGRHNFVQFRYGPQDNVEDAAKIATSRSAELAERAVISAKLESIKLAGKRAKAVLNARRGDLDAGGHDVGGQNGGDKQQQQGGGEVVIGWKHIVKALGETRPSISSEERARLARIYREFVVGRSGDMKDGQGSMEVGGRSSLM